MSGSQANTLKEFLVSIGWQVNADQQKQFQAALDSVTAAAGRLSIAVEGAASATLGAVRQMTDNLEQLYYSSQRAGTSALNMKALEFGMSQIGLNAQTAKGALESFSMAMRLNPGTEGLLNAFQIQTRDAKGKLLDTEKIMMGFLERTRNMPFFQSSQLAQMFGMDPKTFLQMQQNFRELIKSQEEFRQMAAASGVDLDRAAKADVEWGRQLNSLGSVFKLLGTSVRENFEEKTLPAVARFKTFILAHFGDISKGAGEASAAIANAAERAAEAAIISAEKIYNSLKGDKQFQSDVRKLEDSYNRLGDTMGGVVKVTGKGLWGDFEDDLEKGIKESTKQLTGFNNALSDAILTAQRLIHGDWTKAWQEFGTRTDDAFAGWRKQWEMFKEDWGSSRMPWSLPMQGFIELMDTADDKLKGLSDRLGNSEAVQWIKGKFGDATLAMSGKSDAGISPQMAAYIDTIAEMESGKNPHAKNPHGSAYGYTQFTDSTWADFVAAKGPRDRNSLVDQKEATAWLAQKEWQRLHPGDDINQALLNPSRWSEIFASNKGRWETLDFGRPGVHPGLVQTLKRLDANMSAQGASAGMQNFGLGADAGGMPVGATVPANRSVVQNNNTKIQVDGSKDPHATANAVGDIQKRLNADMIRNLSGMAAWSPTN